MRLHRSTRSPAPALPIDEESESSTPAADQPTVEETTVDETVDSSVERPQLPVFTSQNDPVRVDGIWTTLSVAGVPAAVLSNDATIAWCNSPFAELGGLTVSEATGKSIDAALGLDRRDRLRHSVVGVALGKAVLQRLEVATKPDDSSPRVLAVSATVTQAWGDEPHIVAIVEDLTSERRRSGDRPSTAIQRVRTSNQDPLTGLPNRATFESLLEASLRSAERDQSTVAVMTCDLDGFALVNERLGHEVGDEVLKWVAGRLTHTLRHHDVLGRFTGDEFVVVAENVADDEVGHLISRRLAAAISEPILINGVEVRVGVSVGFALAQPNVAITDLLEQAQRALMAAKRAGKGRSMSFAEVVRAEAESLSTEIDWNELSQVGTSE